MTGGGGPKCEHCGHLLMRHRSDGPIFGKPVCGALMKSRDRCRCTGFAPERPVDSWGVEAYITRQDGVERREVSKVSLSYGEAVEEAVQLARLGLRVYVVDPQGRRSREVGLQLKT